MDSQNPECNLHVESQRNASLENEYSKFLLSIVYIKWVIYILRSFLLSQLNFEDSFWEDSSIFEDSFWENIFGKK